MTTHRLNLVQIELDTNDGELARVLMGRLSTLRERRMAPLLDRVMSELSGPERIDRIDVLELELGEIPVGDGFDDAFVRALEEALRQALRQRLSTSQGAEPSWRRAVELVELHARTGNLPWWADAGAPDAVGKELEALARAAPRELLALVRRLDGDERALERIAACCEADLLSTLFDEIVALGEPELRRELADPLGDQTDQLGDQRVRARASTVAGRVELLRTLAQHRGRRADAAVGYGDGRGRAARSSSLDGRLGPRPLEASSAPVSPTAPHDLRSGPGDEPESGETTRYDEAPPASPASLEPRGRSEHASTDRVGRAHDVASSLEPRAGLETADRELATARDSPASLTEAGDPRELPAGSGDASGRSEAGTAPAPPRASPRVEQARRAALASLEQLYVDDAGLVILWPFLPRLFERVGLLDEDARFVDPQASMQAVALLELLATADPEPPEHRLALAKLLCGLAPDDRYVLPSPLLPSVVAEAEPLLRAVIGHASVLGEMTIPGFRTSFLQRAGVLTTHQGTWRLQVTPQTHDVVLERFGWAWAWLKLPWMPNPLRVEW